MRIFVSLAVALCVGLAPVTSEARPKIALRTVADPTIETGIVDPTIETGMVDPTIETGIAVFRRAGAKPQDYWCNAGDFAARRLGAGTGTALELVRPEGAAGGPSDRASIGFRVVAGDGQSGSVTVSAVGERHSLAQTRAFCLGQVDPGRQ